MTKRDVVEYRQESREAGKDQRKDQPRRSLYNGYRDLAEVLNERQEIRKRRE